MASQGLEAKRSKVIARYRSHFRVSGKLFARAQKVMPGGVNHYKREMSPFPVYVERGAGSHKWSADGHELIDYWVGHGALILGHLHPQVAEAVRKQLERGTHPGACHELEVQWAELVTKMIPCADRVRFVSSGTEATHLAIRMARAFTGRKKVIKFAGHFHGWHNDVAMSVEPPFYRDTMPGIPQEAMKNTVVLPPSDIEKVDRCLDKGDVACVILEPTGGSYGQVPLRPGFLEELRDVTAKHDALLIFDEVITGFRCAPGGAQERFKVTPDLAALAKVLAGGLPGGAVAGREEIMDVISPKATAEQAVRHQGTFNANPLSAAAGIATLRLLKDGKAIRRADEAAAAIRKGMREIVARMGLDWLVFGDFSFFHILTHSGDADPERLWERDPEAMKRASDAATRDAFRCAMLLHGVDTFGLNGFVCAEHSDDDVARTLEAFEKTLRLLA